MDWASVWLTARSIAPTKETIEQSVKVKSEVGDLLTGDEICNDGRPEWVEIEDCSDNDRMPPAKSEDVEHDADQPDQEQHSEFDEIDADDSNATKCSLERRVRSMKGRRATESALSRL